jgi:2,3-bisphosphoglycerate-independent phosphoglycerate mutase
MSLYVRYLPSFVIEEGGKPVGEILDNDAVLFCNFRGDRAIEISRAFDEAETPAFNYFDRERVPAVRYAGLMRYLLPLPIFRLHHIDNPLSLVRLSVEHALFSSPFSYDGDQNIPKNYLVDPPLINRTSGEYVSLTSHHVAPHSTHGRPSGRYLAQSGVSTFAISETQKYISFTA